MTVGDDQCLVAHLVLHRRNHARIGNLPHSVRDSVFVGNVDRRGGAGLRREQGINLPGIFIEQKQLFVVRAGGPKQVEPVGLGLGESLLVAEDDLGGIVFDPAQGDESPALKAGSRRRCEALGIAVNGGRGIRPKDRFRPPSRAYAAARV